MRRILISFLLVLTPILAHAEANDSEAVSLLTETRELLGQEKIRWQRIHETPYTDQVTLTQTGKELTIDVCIDPKVQNIINKEPITRKYVFEQNTVKRLWYVPPYAGVAAHVSADGLRPALYAGWGKEILTYGIYHGYVGAGPYTTLTSAGCTIFYRDSMWYTVSIMITVGCTWSGKLFPGFAIGFGW